MQHFTYLKADLSQLVCVDEQASVEHKGGLGHVLVDSAPVDIKELLPFSRNDDGFLVRASRKGGFSNSHLLFNYDPQKNMSGSVATSKKRHGRTVLERNIGAGL